MAFLGDEYLLNTREGIRLFQQIKDLPIIDAHSHVDAEQIARNEGWADIWEVEAATDHYVWELMRRSGVPEEKITGEASNEEKWLALAEVFPRFAGNPVYDWIHLDLRFRFGITDPIGPDTAQKIWEETKELLTEPWMRPQRLLKDMQVEILCTTDSPLSRLEWHDRLARELPGLKVLPTWRPDEILWLGTDRWQSFIEKLAERTGQDSSSFTEMLIALEKTHRYFRDHRGVASDHGIERPWGYLVNQKRAARIYQKALHGQVIGEGERRDFQAFMLHFFAELNVEAGWIMQLHIGAVRDYRDRLLYSLGKDSGGDISTHDIEVVEGLREFLNEFDDRLKIVLYSLHPSHLYTILTLARSFPNVYIGASWWFQDNPYHMREQLEQIADVDLLANHAGMVTDSRKLFSYESRTEMFRRVLADVLGGMVEQGRIPYEVAKELGAQVAYYHPKELFFSNIKGEDSVRGS